MPKEYTSHNLDTGIPLIIWKNKVSSDSRPLSFYTKLKSQIVLLHSGSTLLLVQFPV